jgi:LCP family protein required for cell wall assembly
MGFHLNRCPACRAHLEASLLNHLLGQPPGQQAAPPLSDAPQPARSTGRMFAYGGLAALALLLVALVWVGGIAWRTNQNLDAMIITPVPTDAQSAAIAQQTATPGPDPASVAPTPTLKSAHLITRELVSAAPPNDQADTPPLIWPTIEVLPSPTIAVPTPRAGEAVTILLLGSDQRPDQTEEPRTDALMLVRVDPVNQRIALLSLPRDLWVEIPGYGFNRINAAYRLGELTAPGSGLEVARRTVSNLTGVPIDYIALVNFQGFVGMVDTLGGITVNVEKELYDTQFPTMDYGYQVVHFEPGRHQMDGDTALIYSRIRHPDSDFVRIRRQQTVLVGIGARLHERGDVHNLLTADQITAELLPYVRTDMPKERIIGLIWALRNYSPDEVEHYTINSDMVTMGVGSDQYALVPYRAAVDQMAGLFLGTGPDALPAP